MSRPRRPRTSVCRGKDCGRTIVWLKTQAERLIPVDEAGVEPLDEYFDRTRHKPHHATCPNAEDFRRKKGPA